MSRYIDADAFEKYLNREEWKTPDEKWWPEREIGMLMDALATADVVEVVHGKWVVCDAPPPTWWYECSICHKAGNVEYNYCPNCGAKMSTQSNAFLTH